MDAPIATIEDYCRMIGIPLPRHASFDVRRFEDNMPTVRQRVAPFRHEFFAVALKLAGTGHVRGGLEDYPLDDGTYLFFNSPFQILGWEIAPDWEGFYLMLTEDFAAVRLRAPDLSAEFPFLRLDRAIPFRVSEADAASVRMLFEKVHAEYHGDAADKFGFIAAYTHLLLRFVKRAFNVAPSDAAGDGEPGVAADYRLVSRFQVLLDETFHADGPRRDGTPTVTELAGRLRVHPNHLNRMVKRVTGRTAKQAVDRQVIAVAKQLLATKGRSVRSVAWRLGFSEPTHFARYFKRLTGHSPTDWQAQQG